MTAPIRISDFSPNDDRFKSCCCHSKTFTIISGILEIFTICFILVAVLPDLNAKLCSSSYNIESDETFDNDTSIDDMFNFTTSYNDSMQDSFYHKFICEISIIFLIWSISQIISVNIMFYGIKIIRYQLFIPHIIFRIAFAALLIFIEVWFISTVSKKSVVVAPYIACIIGIAILLITWLYALWVEIRCAHFIKRSHETGFSISVARPIGPSTVSLTEREAPPIHIPIRQLPPLRHAPPQNIINEVYDKLDD